MSGESKIEWTDATWNPVTGCTKVSQGCKYCYAERDWKRLSANPKTVYHGRAFSDVRCHPERLEQPMRWTKPRRIFVNSMSDLFHEAVPEEFIWSVWLAMSNARRHTFQVLTKRPDRMRAVVQRITKLSGYAVPNVWLGVSAENQAAADERIPLLLETPAAVRFVSIEPMLGAVDLTRVCDRSSKRALWINAIESKEANPAHAALVARFGSDYPYSRIDWVIVGGESGPHARPMHPDWPRSLRDECSAAGVPFLFKQWGEWLPGHHYDAGHQERDPGLEQSRFDCAQWDGESWDIGRPLAVETYDEHALFRVGKKAAGRQLDGREWNEFPQE